MGRRVTVAGCCGLLFLAGWVFGERKLHAYNGTTWKTLSHSEQATYVLGFVHGYESGVVDHMLCKGCSGPQIRPQLQEFQADWGARAQNRIDIFIKNNPVDPIVDTMSTFYGDYRNVGVCWGDTLMLSAASLAGQPPTGRELDAARKVAAESGCMNR